VLLLSVDPEYFGKKEQYEPQAERLFKKLDIDWPNVWVSGGWGEMNCTFNADGYGKILVDAKGIVRGINLHGEELARRVREITAR
jgi:hypothetical protein